MKIRKDFVTNSSSSSYICDACGHVESGWDICLSDAEMCECENGHTVCLDEMGELTFEAKLAYLIRTTQENIKYNKKNIDENPDRTYYYDRLKECEADLAKLNGLTEKALDEDSELEDWFDDLCRDSELEYNYPAEVCPLCNHSIIADYELINYACNQLGISKEELTRSAREFLIAEDNAKKNK